MTLPYTFWWVGLLPLLVVAGMGHALPQRERWHLLAAAFTVSWIADTTGYIGYRLDAQDNRWFTVASQTYPLLQGGLFALALSSVPVTVGVVAGLAAISGLSIAWRGAVGLDVALHVTAFAATAVLAWVCLRKQQGAGPLRWTLVLGFGALAVAWCASVWLNAIPDTTWRVYGWIRVLTALGFTWAAWDAMRVRRAE